MSNTKINIINSIYSHSQLHNSIKGYYIVYNKLESLNQKLNHEKKNLINKYQNKISYLTSQIE